MNVLSGTLATLGGHHKRLVPARGRGMDCTAPELAGSEHSKELLFESPGRGDMFCCFADVTENK